MLAGAAVAGERENALNHIAQVIAVSQLCDKVTLNTTMIALLAARFGVDFERDKIELATQIANQSKPWKAEPNEAICGAGVYLYGPNGQNVPGLLALK